MSQSSDTPQPTRSYKDLHALLMATCQVTYAAHPHLSETCTELARKRGRRILGIGIATLLIGLACTIWAIAVRENTGAPFQAVVLVIPIYGICRTVQGAGQIRHAKERAYREIADELLDNKFDNTGTAKDFVTFKNQYKAAAASHQRRHQIILGVCAAIVLLLGVIPLALS